MLYNNFSEGQDQKTDQNRTNSGSTPYDDVFRTLVVEHKGLLLKLLNEMFTDIHYEGDEEVNTLNNAYFANRSEGNQDKMITDSAIEIIDHYGCRKLFHLECQSDNNGTMILRMFEYDVQIAIKEDSSVSDDRLIVNLPASGVLYLRSNSATPDNMIVTVNVPSGDHAQYRVPIMKLKDYSCDDIIDKELYFLIPFYLFNFEGDFDKIESQDEAFLDNFRKRYQEIYDKLREKLERGQIDVLTHHSIIMLSKKVIAALTAKRKVVKEEAERIMGGQVLDYETKELIRTGIAQGMSKQSADDIQKLADFFQKTNPEMTEKEAFEEAKKVLSN
ncbi:hypothetical protein [Butyrivibrio sp. INlla16]|uniref:hypothetical protein n=1 Tax=Butyrivibrio sp. INlla16 TaxID=1520807 RepID=UPI0008843B56|nr:hypothetical protein [Butyrivibrio sp. INlla16]SDB07738.1 hypothetical protein SAMN02910263_00321 [Butyrivibrio sp. INlla16]